MNQRITAAIIDSMTAPAPAHTVTVTWATPPAPITPPSP